MSASQPSKTHVQPTDSNLRELGSTGDEAGKITRTRAEPDVFGAEPSHDRESGGPPSEAKSVFSHENDPDAHPESRDLSRPDKHSIEALASDTQAQNQPIGKFQASLDAAQDKQEQSGSTAI